MPREAREERERLTKEVDDGGWGYDVLDALTPSDAEFDAMPGFEELEE